MLQVKLSLVVGLHHLVLVLMPVQHSRHLLWGTIIIVNLEMYMHVKTSAWYPDDPLRDNDGCLSNNTCCDPPNLL